MRAALHAGRRLQESDCWRLEKWHPRSGAEQVHDERGPRSRRTALRAARAYDDVAHPGQRSSRAGARAPDGARRPAVRSTGAPARRAWARQRVHAMFTWRWAPRFVSRAGFGQAGSARPRSAPSPPSDRRALGTFWSRWEAFSAEPHASR